jgi:hypothetical protein
MRNHRHHRWRATDHRHHHLGHRRHGVKPDHGRHQPGRCHLLHSTSARNKPPGSRLLRRYPFQKRSLLTPLPPPVCSVFPDMLPVFRMLSSTLVPHRPCHLNSPPVSPESCEASFDTRDVSFSEGCKTSEAFEITRWDPGRKGRLTATPKCVFTHADNVFQSSGSVRRGTTE